jgi:hypothetical protein
MVVWWYDTLCYVAAEPADRVGSVALAEWAYRRI